MKKLKGLAGVIGSLAVAVGLTGDADGQCFQVSPHRSSLGCFRLITAEDKLPEGAYSTPDEIYGFGGHYYYPIKKMMRYTQYVPKIVHEKTDCNWGTFYKPKFVWEPHLKETEIILGYAPHDNSYLSKEKFYQAPSRLYDKPGSPKPVFPAPLKSTIPKTFKIESKD